MTLFQANSAALIPFSLTYKVTSAHNLQPKLPLQSRKHKHNLLPISSLPSYTTRNTTTRRESQAMRFSLLTQYSSQPRISWSSLPPKNFALVSLDLFKLLRRLEALPSEYLFLNISASTMSFITIPAQSSKKASPPSLLPQDSEEYKVQEILSHCTLHSGTEYLILWKGYKLEDST
ncbi:hypothetical protein DSO57_1034632 [Entomophthora muscae]|uniref:Uncharacterized protein n=1 Tax=Entomophthora muscae TaxID=34485 RepID=A0ACC2UJN5_9FUNG|nr:hypothetical protein DSO57_1034632 [Entomophthora muscae]